MKRALYRPTWLLALGLCACAGPRTDPADNAPTLKTLATKPIVIAKDTGIARNEEKAIAAYRKFLEVAPQARERPEAMRRLGDLEMDRADNRAAGEAGSEATDYRAAIARYQEFLRAFPKDAAIDRVLYQLARAQEQGGDLETALKTLDRLVLEHPATATRDEANFRRGELLFATRDYVRAEQAYATVLRGGTRNPYEERALYMQGWSIFKQGRLDEALPPFFGVLDRKLKSDDSASEPAGLSRADRELVEDTFRVMSISLANLQGVDSIPRHTDSDLRRGYEFRIFQQLGELYLKQDRAKDAADAFAAFARRQPLHAQAPLLQARVIDIHQQAGFTALALDAKKDYVARYGIAGDFRRANPAGWELAQPLVKIHLAELARHHHAAAQKSKRSADYQEAVHWYRAYLVSFPSDPQSAQNNFLLAELLFEDGRLAAAAIEYEGVAYKYPRHARSADAGYAALLSYAGQEKAAVVADAPALQRAAVDSALRFAQAFPGDARAGGVLGNAAEKLYALNDGDGAAAVAQQVLALQPPPAAAERRTAWTVLAHTAFERGAFIDAERAYAEVIALTPEQAAGRGALVERLAASAYKQGEQARAAGQARAAVAHFDRVATLAPQSAVRATAQYDAAAALISLKDWDAAARALEDFRRRYPNHALAGEVGGKLALAYLEQGQWAQAAAEFERLAVASKDPAIARGALWQAAELHEKAGARGLATKAYERYLLQNPQSLEPALEARWRLARIAKEERNAAREFALMKEVFQADQAGGAARTVRTRHLGALAALALAEPVFEAYRKVALVEPLARTLKAKKSKLEDVLKAYAVAAGYGVAEVGTAATYRTAALYQDFGRALIASQRPRGLKKAELEQYNVMLEEQAYPFEEKAIELHEANARRAADGLWDEWVRASFKSLAEIRPVRYAKTEQGASTLDLAALERAIKADAPTAQQFNQIGVAYRQQGRFKQAREAYEAALALDAAYAPATLNLGVLFDLYLGDRARALSLYERYLALVPADAGAVTKWVADLKNRKPALAALASKEKP